MASIKTSDDIETPSVVDLGEKPVTKTRASALRRVLCYVRGDGLACVAAPACIPPGAAVIGTVRTGLHGTVPGAKNGENRPEWRPEVSFGVVRCHLAGGVAPTRSCGGGNQPL